MAKNAYQAVVIFTLRNGEDAVAGYTERFLNLIKEHSDDVKINEEWGGKKKFAYPIEDETEGVYVEYDFTSEPEFPAELNRIVNITDYAMRVVVFRKDEE